MTSRTNRPAWAVIPCALVISFIAASANAITLGQVDDFEDGSTMGWTGNFNTFNVEEEGPAGIGDRALRIDSFARMIAKSDEIIDPDSGAATPTQWRGNYLAAGVAAISMDVKNPNDYALSLYLGIANSTVSSRGEGATYITDYSLMVPADDSWHSVTFPIAASDFVASDNNTEGVKVGPAAILQNVFQLRIFHSTIPGEFRGDEVAGHFYVDNITAVGASSPANANFDGDGDVDGQDFLIWQRGVGIGTTPATGDANSSGSVNGDDLAIWKSQFGPAALPVAAAVPEPCAVTLGALAVLAAPALTRRLRR